MHVAPSQQLGLALWITACAVALWRGGLPERAFALVILLVIALTLALQDMDSIHGVQWTLLAGDVAMLIAAVALLARFPARRWLIWATGVQFVSVLSHVPRMLDASIRVWGYATLLAVWGYGLLVALLWGALVESRTDHAR